MFKNVTIRARLTLALGLFMVLLVVGAAAGLLSLQQSNASLRDIYRNDMASSRSLAQTTISTLTARVTLSRIEFIADPTEIKTAIERVRQNLKAADDAWGAYAAKPMSDSEKPLADAVISARGKVVNEGIVPALKAIESGDIPDFHAKTVMDVPRLFSDYTKAMVALADLQNNGALVIGSGRAYDASLDYLAPKLTFSLDGVNIAPADTGFNTGGDPRTLLTWLVNHNGKRGITMHAGAVITCGSYVGMLPARGAGVLRGTIDGIGEASVTLK